MKNISSYDQFLNESSMGPSDYNTFLMELEDLKKSFGEETPADELLDLTKRAINDLDSQGIRDLYDTMKKLFPSIAVSEETLKLMGSSNPMDKMLAKRSVDIGRLVLDSTSM
jgi:hypothetical protein